MVPCTSLDLATFSSVTETSCTSLQAITLESSQAIHTYIVYVTHIINTDSFYYWKITD